MGVRLAMLGLFLAVGGLGSTSASGSQKQTGAPTGVLLTSRGGRIIAVNADGSGIRELTRPPGDGYDGGAKGSPDGSAITFARDFKDVYVLDTDGSVARRVGPGDDPVWSPDSQSLAASTFPIDETLAEVYVMKADGTSARKIGRGAGPAWSPDGQWLAYEGDLNRDDSSVFIARLDGSKTLRLQNSYGYDWSPDGRWVAYTNGGNLRVTDPRTAEARLVVPRLALGQGLEIGDFSWSPDGGRLAFSTAGPTHNGPVYVVALDGSSLRRRRSREGQRRWPCLVAGRDAPRVRRRLRKRVKRPARRGRRRRHRPNALEAPAGRRGSFRRALLVAGRDSGRVRPRQHAGLQGGTGCLDHRRRRFARDPADRGVSLLWHRWFA